MRQQRNRIGMAACGWLSAVAAVLGLQRRALGAVLHPVPFPVTLAATMVPSLLVTGPLEGAYTLLTLSLIRKARLHELA